MPQLMESLLVPVTWSLLFRRFVMLYGKLMLRKVAYGSSYRNFL